MRAGSTPAAEALDTESGVGRRAVVHHDLLTGGMAVALARVRGDADRLRDILADTDEVIRYDVVERLDLSTTTVREHLRKIEARLRSQTTAQGFVDGTPALNEYSKGASRGRTQTRRAPSVVLHF